MLARAALLGPLRLHFYTILTMSHTMSYTMSYLGYVLVLCVIFVICPRILRSIKGPAPPLPVIPFNPFFHDFPTFFRGRKNHRKSRHMMPPSSHFAIKTNGFSWFFVFILSPFWLHFTSILSPKWVSFSRRERRFFHSGRHWGPNWTPREAKSPKWS